MPEFGRMNHSKITIILGAGASKAYQWSYPLLPDLLPEMLLYAEKLIGRGHKQRLYLAFALTMAYELQSPILEDGVIHADIIEEQFECVKRLSRNKPNINITKIFDKLETINPPATIAYWALSHAIGIYMFQMRMADIGQSYIGDVDNAHGEIVYLIDDFLSEGICVDVVDFNYDCVLEYVRFGLGRPGFGWDCGRERKVIVDSISENTLSELVENEQLQKPEDEEEYSTFAGLIKPHGDMCTFLRGQDGIFYRGVRHSSTTSAIFPLKLKDISPEDTFVRSSILPPTNSRFRHSSDFYRVEEERFIKALNESTIIIIIGWSASGTDDYYQNIFHNLYQDRSTDLAPNLFVIDYSPDGSPDINLQNRLRNLFCGKAKFIDFQMCGFKRTAVEHFKKILL